MQPEDEAMEKAQTMLEVHSMIGRANVLLAILMNKLGIDSVELGYSDLVSLEARFGLETPVILCDTLPEGIQLRLLSRRDAHAHANPKPLAGTEDSGILP